MTPEEQQALLEQELLNYMYGSNEYGIGPAQLQTDSDLYKGLGYAEDAISDIFKIAGIYPEDTLNLPEPPQDPGPAPERPDDVFQSDLATAYQGNPLAALAFQEMQNGADPVTAANLAYQAYQESPDQYSAYIPQQFDQGAPVPPERAVLGFLSPLTTQYGTELARERREGGAADQEYQQAMADYTRQQRDYHAYNNPTSEFWRRGSPEFSQDLAAQKARLNPANFEGPERRAPAVTEGGYRSSRQPRGGQSTAPKPEPQRDLSYGSKQALGRMTHYSRDRQKEDVKPAGRDIENKRRLAMAQVLLGMR